MGKIFKALEKSKRKNFPRGASEDYSPQEKSEPYPSHPPQGAPEPYISHPSQATPASYSQPAENDQTHGHGATIPPVQKSPLKSGVKPPSPAASTATDPAPADPPLSPPAKLHETLVAHSRPHSPESEQFRMLKTTILFPDKGLPPRTIMITSSAPGDGKSFVAANLAVSMANGIDEHVLLMDCDLRKPTLHRLFGFSDTISGLSEYLTRGAPLASILKKTRVPKLTLLPCGTPPSNPSELISSDQMKKLIQEVRSRYPDRYIILDAPPPDVTSEANALARQVEAIIIVVKAGYSKKTALKDIVETYGRKKILGVVKNYAEKTKAYHYGA